MEGYVWDLTPLSPFVIVSRSIVRACDEGSLRSPHPPQVYTPLMSTVAQRLRRDDIERLRRMTPAARVAEALALGCEAAEAYAHAHGLDLTEARLRLERAGQAGRRPSRVMQGILE